MGCVQILNRATKLTAATMLAFCPLAAAAQDTYESKEAWSQAVWAAASTGDTEGTLEILSKIPDSADPANVTDIRPAIELLKANFEKQQKLREEQIAEQREELTTLLEESKDNAPDTLSEALADVLFLDSIVENHDALLAEPEIRDLMDRAAERAAKAEAEQDWLAATELYARLDMLEEASQKYKKDLQRQMVRREMLTLYVPERYWQLRDERLKELGEEGLPPFNNRGEDYREKLAGVTPELVLAAISQAARHHISGTSMKQMVIGGLDNLSMMIHMNDLQQAFPKLADARAVEKFDSYIKSEKRNLRNSDRDMTIIDLRRTLNRLIEINTQTVGLPREVVIHEFGSGAMGTLDEFSQIVWPFELKTFYKRLDSSFIGVGIQIVNDPVTGDLQVYTPMPGMPAVRAGVRAGDIIVKVDGESTVGMTTSQAVDVITGPRGTPVTLTIKRIGDDGEEIIKDITIVRDQIEVATVSGWRKLGPGKDDWDWFVDHDQKIGYIRLDKFAQDSANEMDRAIAKMKREGLNGLILDLRFNPGGQLNQAIEVANRFIEKGTIVSTVNSRTEPPRSHSANKWKATLAGLPVVVLVNANSASSSEIVAGAIKDYGDAGDIHAIVLGHRSYGKGTVQNLHSIAGGAAMKVTTQYYTIPSGKVIHRRPGHADWGINPDLTITLLPSQITDWLTLRRDADVFLIDENGQVIDDEKNDKPDPQKLLDEGIDLQLETAVVLLKSQAPMATGETALRSNDG